jgi:two-component system, sensor histidine kinase LadS
MLLTKIFSIPYGCIFYGSMSRPLANYMKILTSQLSLFVLLFAAQGGFAAVPVTVDEALTFKNMSGNVEYIEDEKRALMFDDVRYNGALKWRQVRTRSINFGFTRSQYWFRFTVDNLSRSAAKWFLEVDFPCLDLVELYAPDGRGQYLSRKTGDSQPFSSRDVPFITYLFRMFQDPGPVTYYLRIDSLDSININVNMLSEAFFMERYMNDMPLYWIFFGIMAVMALYNIFIFIPTRDREHVYLALAVITFALFEFNFKGFGSQYLWQNAAWWTDRANPFLVSLTCVWVDLFVLEFVGVRKHSPRLYRFSLLTITLPGLILTALSLLIDLQVIIITVISFTVYVMVMIVAKGVYLLIVKNPAMRQALIALIAFSMIVITMPFVALTMMGMILPNFYTRWALQFGSTAAVLFLSFGMAIKINMMKNRIQKAERKYRHLVESTSDIIFTLDGENRILSVNGAVTMHLGFGPGELAGTNFIDLIQEHLNKKNDVAQQMVLGNINDLMMKKTGSAQFRTTMKDKFSHEPKELTVSLEYNRDARAGYAILGKASPVIDDTLTRFIVGEECSYDLNNYLGNAELMSQRLVRNLSKFIDPLTVSDVRIGLREAIINAIEHGNLQMNFKAKTEAHRAGSYFDLIRERQMDPALNRKKVRVTCSLNEDRVSYIISDEGQGFDIAAMETLDPDSVNAASLTHGRGLHMVRSAFDAVRFNDKGNQLLLVKYFRGER